MGKAAQRRMPGWNFPGPFGKQKIGRTERILIMKTRELKNSARMKLNLIHFAALTAVSWFGMCPSSRADFTFDVAYQNGGGEATFLAEGASNPSSFSLNPGNLVLESVTNLSGASAYLGTVQIMLTPQNSSQATIDIGVLPNGAPPGPLIAKGGTYTFNDAIISSALISSVLTPTWNIEDSVKVEGTWKKSACAPEPLSILGAVVALGFGIALKRLKPKLIA